MLIYWSKDVESKSSATTIATSPFTITDAGSGG
jgi:hypothetical protein